MSIYARIQNGVVAEFPPVPSGFTLAQSYTAALVAQCVDVTSVTPAPQLGWTATETNDVWAFAAPIIPTPPAPTLAQQAAAALNAGLAITSTSTPSLNGTYDVSAASQDHFTVEMVALLNSGGTAFADGTASVAWPDMASPPINHTFTAAEFKPFASAVASYVAGLYKCINGVLTTLPPATATIA